MRQRLSALGIAIIVAFAGALGAGGTASAAPTGPEAPILHADSPNAVADRYIVVFKDSAVSASTVGAEARDMAGRFRGKVRHVYTAGLRGFSVGMTAAQARKLAADPSVASIEAVQRMGATDTQGSPPNWGDDRIDQQSLPLNQAYTYPANPGQGVTVYVLDTGINANHADFTGRVKQGTDIVDGDSTPNDCHGHGTHVAGTAVGTTYGVAKKASVVSVRVLNCQGSGYNDDFIAGMNWIRDNAQKPAVVNYSIGCSGRCSSQALDSAVSSLISSGVQFFQAAGNSNDDACYYSPQGVAAAVTIGNTNSSDARNSSSSWGSCLDIFAPGTSIVSASHSNNTGTATMTGTSMASPHTAGAAAVYLGLNPNATPAQVRDALVNNATTGQVTSPGTGSPNRLLYTGFMNGGTNPNNPSVTNPGNRSTAVGQSVSLQLQATGGTTPYTWSAAGLPAGLSISSSSGLITGSPSTAGTSNVTVTVTDSASKTGTAGFTWTVAVNPPSVSYQVTARHSGKVMDVIGGSTADGAEVKQWTWNGGSNQKWVFEDAGSGYYRIVNQNSGKCLDVASASTADAANVIQYTCGSGTNQQWQWVAIGSYFQLKARHSGKCLDVAGASTADGGDIHQYTCGSQTNQQWSRTQS